MRDNFEVRLVGNADDRWGVYRTRYEVYVEELGWTSRYADVTNRTISDGLDASANIFAAFRGPEVLGTLRTHHSGVADLSEYVDLYGMRAALNQNKRSVAIATMLIVRKASRLSRIAYELMAAAIEKGVSEGIELVFIDCVPAMVPFYRKVGFKLHLPSIVHPEYGSGVCMSLAIKDCPLMKAISPAAPIANSHREEPTLVLPS